MQRSAYLIIPALAAGFSSARASEYGLVLSSTPMTVQASVPQTLCHDELQPVAPVASGAGALLGAVLGGLVGSTIGGGSGQAAATGLGVVAGAIAGERSEATHSPAGLTPVRRCHTTHRSETRLVGYDIVYEYRGQRYAARVAEDPGSRIPLNVSVTPAGGIVADPPQAYVAVQPQVLTPIYASPPVYQYGYTYGHPYRVAPIALVPSLTIGGHWHRGGRHR